HEMTDFLGPDHDPNEYEKIDDIVDVWFESGSTHAFVLEGRDELCWPADLYLEGSDQHRGWFQSSLLESVGTRGTAPFKAVMTHGFVLDGAGRKMSKSLGNVIKPEKIVDKFGADILRMWIAGADYFDDIRISDDIIKGQVDAYRRLRNTLRYILGNLDGFTKAESLPVEQMPELERWVLHRLTEMNDMLAEGVETLSFHRFYAALHAFCATDLSAVYFDIRKDTLYCDRADSIRRRAARTVLDILFQTLVTWLAPVLCFTTEEAWLARYPETDSSVHLQAFTEISASLRDEKLAARWARLREIKKVVTGALEIARADKTIGSSLQAKPVLYLTDQADRALVDSVDLADLVITSDIEVVTGPGPEEAFFLTEVAGVAVVVAMAEGTKCARCWRILSEVGGRNDHPDLCLRCADATEHASEAAA
ncbi:MAG: class I tRNA ligase family protein, partial [Pseudomonadota bacterium]|nr:class I tRNA ligase family protein [Pseudomonadota bacterium]